MHIQVKILPPHQKEHKSESGVGAVSRQSRVNFHKNAPNSTSFAPNLACFTHILTEPTRALAGTITISKPFFAFKPVFVSYGYDRSLFSISKEFFMVFGSYFGSFWQVF